MHRYTGECRGQYGLFPGNYVKIEETNVAESASGGNDLIIKVCFLGMHGTQFWCSL